LERKRIHARGVKDANVGQTKMQSKHLFGGFIENFQSENIRNILYGCGMMLWEYAHFQNTRQFSAGYPKCE
jgi:hypothetical protein